MHARAAALVVMLIATGGCSRARTVSSLRDALVSGDSSRLVSAVEGAPTCASTGGRASNECLAKMADWFGANQGFQAREPDQATAAVAALAVARDGRGEAVPDAEIWLLVLRAGQGAGGDALRLAMTARMVKDAPALARALDADSDARALMSAVSASVPGACETYALLGAGNEGRALPPQMRADHAPCVQKDLDRVTGPSEHGRYGFGVWRGAAGALALWMDAAASLHGGIPKSDPAVAAVLNTRLAAIDAAMAKITLKQLPPMADPMKFVQETHETPPRARLDGGP